MTEAQTNAHDVSEYTQLIPHLRMMGFEEHNDYFELEVAQAFHQELNNVVAGKWVITVKPASWIPHGIYAEMRGPLDMFTSDIVFKHKEALDMLYYWMFGQKSWLYGGG